MHFSILLCYTSMHCWKDSSGMTVSSIITLLSVGLLAFKINFLDYLLVLEGNEKSHTKQDQVNLEVIPVRWYSWLGNITCSGCCEQVHCHGEAAMICLATFKQNLFVDLLMDWQELVVDDILHINECKQNNFDHLAIFSFGDIEDLLWLLWHLVSESYSKIFVSSPVMTLRSKSSSVWRYLIIHWYTYMWSSWLSFCNLGTICALTFCMLKLSVMIFQMLSFFISSWLSIIRQSTNDHYTPHALHIQSWTRFYLLKASCSWSHLWPPYVLLWSCWATQKCVCDMVLSSYTCWSILSACNGVLLSWTKNFRIIQCS